MINLYSDTQTEPTPGMREAMAAASVGDEQFGRDPTVNALCERVAALLGHERAVFLPSGTMANLISILVHCRPGDELIAEASSHIVSLEGAGAAAIAGIQARPISGQGGVFDAQTLGDAVRAPNRYRPRSALVTIENTTNLGGGRPWPVETFDATVDAARGHGLRVHLDGARLMNAAVAEGVPPARYGAACDSAWIALTKGLGCPVGAVLVGSAAFIDAAWQWKQRLGGAMRQAGVLAAAGLHALDTQMDRLAEDHRNAKHLASGLAGIAPFVCDPGAVETNIVIAQLPSDAHVSRLATRLLEDGVRVSAFPGGRMRLVTHFGIAREDVDTALTIIGAACNDLFVETPALAAVGAGQ